MWDVRNEAVKKSIKNTEYLSKMINGQHPITAIEAALKGDQPTRGMLKLFRSLKGDFEEPAKQAMGEAIINRAFINAGGTGGIINAKALYRSFYEPMPDNPSVTMMSLLRSQGIFKPDQVRQIDYITKQLIKLEIAENAGNLMKNGVINEQLLEEVGPLFDFFVAISGSAIGTRAGSALTGGQPGPGSIMMASKGANFLRSLLINMPASEKLNLVTELFTNKQLFLNFIKKPKSEKEKIQIQNNIANILIKGANTLGIDKSVKIAPSVIREAGEEDSIPTDETIEFLERRDMSSVEPSIQEGIPTTQVASSQPFLSGLNTAPAGGGISSAAPANINRAQYASLFPNDIISGMIKPMREGGAVDETGQDDDIDYTDVDYGYTSDEGGSTDDFDISTDIGKATGGNLVGEIPFDVFNLRDKMNKQALESLKQGVQPSYTYDSKGNITSVTSPGAQGGLPTPVSMMANALTRALGGTTTTGYNMNVNLNDGSEGIPQTGIATLSNSPSAQYKRAIDLYNMNPNRYKLFG